MGHRDDRTRKVFQYICQYNREYRFPPTLEEIADMMGFRSNSGVLRHLDKLEKWGWIERYHGQARSIRIIEDCEIVDIIS